LLNSFWVMIIIWVCNILSLSYNCRVIRMFHTALKSQMVCGAWKLPNRTHCRDGHSGRTLTHLCSLPKEGWFAWTIVQSNFSIRSRTSEQLNHVSSFSSELVDNFKESQGNLDNMFSLRSCGKPCAFSTSNMVSSGWPLLSALFNTSEFWTWFTTTHADGVVLEDYYRFKKVRDSYLRNI